jgi:hypothetical protein
MIPLAPMLIDRVAHLHTGDAAAPQKDALALSDRLNAAALHSDERRTAPHAATNDLSPVMQFLLEQFKEQVLMPDADDPGSCPTLDPNASW